MNGLRMTYSFIVNHPCSQGRVMRNLARFVGWQLYSRIVSRPLPFVMAGTARLHAAKGIWGATGNLYVGLHEFQEMAFALHFLRSQDLFVDGGANIGSYTVLGLSLGAHVIAFEPSPDAFAWFTRNAALNATGIADLRQQALSDSPGVTYLTEGRGPQNQISDAGTIRVTKVRLDDALKGVAPTIMKLDLEGHTTMALQGADAALKDLTLKCVIIEAEQEDGEILKAYGFTPHTYDPWTRSLSADEAATLYVRDVAYVTDRCAQAPAFLTHGHLI